MKKYLAFIIISVISLGLFMSGCQSDAQNVFTVGFDQEFPPMGFVDDAGKYVGFDLDLAAEVAKRMEMELKLQPIAWDSKDMELDSGNIDCVWNGFTISGREEEYEWTQPYMKNKQIVVVMNQSSYQTLDDLVDKTIALQRDSSAQSALDANEQFKSSVKVEYTDTNLNALMNLESGAVDGVLMDEIVARYSIEKRQSEYRILDNALSEEVFGVGFKKGNTVMRDKVQKCLDEMSQDGTLANISNTWFGKDITTFEK